MTEDERDERDKRDKREKRKRETSFNNEDRQTHRRTK